MADEVQDVLDDVRRCKEQFQSRSYSSKNEMIAAYEEIYSRTPNDSELHASFLTKLNEAIADDNENSIISALNSFSLLCDTGEDYLHYAAMKNNVNLIIRLLKQGADVNVGDDSLKTPLHIAAEFAAKDAAKVLLENGAVFNAVDKQNRKPLDVTTSESLITLLQSTESLFKSVKKNNSAEVMKNIELGAVVNARNVADKGTPLHYASWKGYGEIVEDLLKKNADPNVADRKGFTPLHYAAKFSHLKIVKRLLFHGAIFEATATNGTTPSGCSSDTKLFTLFHLINNSFDKVKNNDVSVVTDLYAIEDIDTIKAVMGGKNFDKRNLVVHAIHCKFSKIDALKEISQDNYQLFFAQMTGHYGNYPRALKDLKAALGKREKILGPDNPGSFDIRINMAQMLYKQGAYPEALTALNEIYQKQRELLGENSADTLRTRSFIGLVLHRQEKNEEAVKLFEEVYLKQKKLLGPDHTDTLDSQFHKGIALVGLKRYGEAIIIYRDVYSRRMKLLGPNHLATVQVQNNLGVVFKNQGAFEEALKIFKEVLAKKKVLLGRNHGDTIRTLHNIAVVLMNQKKYSEAVKIYQDVLEAQKKVFLPSHPEILDTQFNMAEALMQQNKYVEAYKLYMDNLEHRIYVLGPHHFTVIAGTRNIEQIVATFKNMGSKVSDILPTLQNKANTAAAAGNVNLLQFFLRGGADVDGEDAEGRTLLHFAAANGHLEVVKILLKNGADATRVTTKGNTPLHIAAVKNYVEIVESLLLVKDRRFVDAKTNASGSTALHIAVKCGSLPVVKCLLRFGAIYNAENHEGKAPIDSSTDMEISCLLKSIDDLFAIVKEGSAETVKEKLMDIDKTIAANVRNNRGNTLLEVARCNDRPVIEKLLRKP